MSAESKPHSALFEDVYRVLNTMPRFHSTAGTNVVDPSVALSALRRIEEQLEAADHEVQRRDAQIKDMHEEILFLCSDEDDIRKGLREQLEAAQQALADKEAERQEDVIRVVEQLEAVARDRNAALGQVDELDEKVRGLSEQHATDEHAWKCLDEERVAEITRLKEQLETHNPEVAAIRDRIATERIAELQEQSEAVREALTELVKLHDGPRDDDYEKRKPLAWAAARAVLYPASEPPAPDPRLIKRLTSDGTHVPNQDKEPS